MKRLDKNQLVTTAFSDDGELRLIHKSRDVVTTIDLDENRRVAQEPDLGISVTAQLSLKGHFGERADEEEQSAIFEHPDESDSHRSPPGTVGYRHEVMSEHVGAKRQKFDKKAGKLLADRGDSDDDTSKEANKSDLTKLSSVAVVSPPIAFVETSRSVQTFKMNYDRLYKQFHE